MKASTFQTLIVGLLCLAVASLSAGLFNQHRHMTELQSTAAQYRQTLDTLQHDSNTLKDAQEKLQYAVKDLKIMVDSGEQQANTLDPMLDQWAQEIQELRDGLTTRATEADLAALSTRVEHVELQLIDIKPQPSSQPPAPAPAEIKPRKTDRTKPTPLSPPFSVLSVESRGGERFLAVAPHHSRSLMDVRLLHSGEQFGAWQLKTLEPNSAVFAVAAQPDQTVYWP